MLIQRPSEQQAYMYYLRVALTNLVNNNNSTNETGTCFVFLSSLYNVFLANANAVRLNVLSAFCLLLKWIALLFLNLIQFSITILIR